MPDPIITAADLEAMRARCEAATEGPWEHEEYGLIVSEEYEIGITPGWREENRAFICHARTDLPRLLSLVAALAERAHRCHPSNYRGHVAAREVEILALLESISALRGKESDRCSR